MNDQGDSNWGLPSLGFRSQIFSDIDRWTERMFKTFEDLEEQAKKGKLPSNTFYYGYSLTVGPDGKPKIREFGNVRPSRNGQVQLSTREPVVETTVDETQNQVKIVAEMPGVKKEEIKTELTENTLVIRAEHGDRKYETMIQLPEPVDANSGKATYNNGVLEINLKMKNPAPPQQQKTTSLKID